MRIYNCLWKYFLSSLLSNVVLLQYLGRLGKWFVIYAWCVLCLHCLNTLMLSNSQTNVLVTLRIKLHTFLINILYLPWHFKLKITIQSKIYHKNTNNEVLHLKSSHCLNIFFVNETSVKFK